MEKEVEERSKMGKGTEKGKLSAALSYLTLIYPELSAKALVGKIERRRHK